MGKIVIYQIFTRLYGNDKARQKCGGTIEENGCGKMADIDDAVLEHIKEMGITHVWYTGIVRHASTTDYTKYGVPRQHPAVVKGRAGSPYAIADYYDVDPDLANDVEKRMDEFESLVKRTHQNGMKVITDFVPNHVARQYRSIKLPESASDIGGNDNPNRQFDAQNNYYYCPGEAFSPSFDINAGEPEPYEESPAKATGNDHFDAHPGRNDWYETVKLNYGVDYCGGRVGHFSPIPSTWKQMLDIVMFWASKGIDGMRCDMAEMVPVEFWSWLTIQVKARYSDFKFIGEVYNPALYRSYIAAGFDYLYDKVGMYDTVRAVTCGHAPATAITGAWQSVDDIRARMLYFLENHDEQRLASDFFAGDGRKGVPALVVCSLLSTNPFMLYAGQEYGERGMDAEGFSGRDGRTTIFDYWKIDTLYRARKGRLTDKEMQLYGVYRGVLRIANKEKAAREGLSFDLMYANPASQGFDPNRHYAFMRKSGNGLLLVVANFGDTAADINVRIPAHAFDYMELAEHKCTATDLLTGDKQRMELRRDGTVAMSMNAYGARVWKMSVSSTRRKSIEKTER